jgi:hypothetical protein
MTYADVIMTRLCREEERRLDAEARQVNVDLTLRSVFSHGEPSLETNGRQAVRCPVVVSGASGHPLTITLTVQGPLEINVRHSNANTWEALVCLDGSDRMLRLHPVSLIGASGQVVLNPFVTLTTLFFRDTYK